MSSFVSVAKIPVRLGLLNMYTSPWLSLASLCCSKQWAPFAPNLLCVGKWLPSFSLISTYSIAGFGSIGSGGGFDKLLRRSRGQCGFSQSTNCGAFYDSSICVRSVSSCRYLQPLVTNRFVGCFGHSEFLLPKNNFITCCSSSSAADMCVVSKAKHCEWLADWDDLASLAVFICVCISTHSQPEEFCEDLQDTIVLAVSFLAKDGASSASSYDSAVSTIGI